MAMQYNVSRLLKSEVGQTRVYDFELDEPMDLDDTVATGVRGHVKFVLTNFGIIANVDAHATLHLTCARCLEPFQGPVDVHFEEEYQPIVDVTTGLPSTAPRNEDASVISLSHTVDLTEAVRENLVLAVEIIPVCSPDCLGLCQTCGVNRNLTPCDCPPVQQPNPFAVLQGLLAESETNSS